MKGPDINGKNDNPHQGFGGVLDKGCLGESSCSLHDHNYTLDPESLTRSWTKNPSLLQVRNPRGRFVGSGRRIVRRQTFISRFPPRSSSLNQGDRFSELRAEEWLENPRPTPLWALNEDPSICKPMFHVHWHSDLWSPIQRRRHTSPPPSLFPSRRPPCEHCAELFALLLTSIIKLKQRMRSQRKARKSSTSASTSYLPSAPASAQTNIKTSTKTNTQAFHVNTSLPFPPSKPRLDKPLPPTPHASTETIVRLESPLTSRGKYAAVLPTPDLDSAKCSRSSEAKLQERAYAIAKTKDDKCAEIVRSKGTAWWVPSLAGPVDSVREAVMWLIWQEEIARREADDKD